MYLYFFLYLMVSFNKKCYSEQCSPVKLVKSVDKISLRLLLYFWNKFTVKGLRLHHGIRIWPGDSLTDLTVALQLSWLILRSPRRMMCPVFWKLIAGEMCYDCRGN